jgi:hypothetical protein
VNGAFKTKTQDLPSYQSRKYFSNKYVVKKVLRELSSINFSHLTIGLLSITCKTKTFLLIHEGFNNANKNKIKHLFKVVWLLIGVVVEIISTLSFRMERWVFGLGEFWQPCDEQIFWLQQPKEWKWFQGNSWQIST